MHDPIFTLEALEPRLLLSADPVATAAPEAVDSGPVILETAPEETEDPVFELAPLPDTETHEGEATPGAVGGSPADTLLAPTEPVSAVPPLSPVSVAAPATERLVTTLTAANPPPEGGPRGNGISLDSGTDGVFRFTISSGNDVAVRLNQGYFQWSDDDGSTWETDDDVSSLSTIKVDVKYEDNSGEADLHIHDFQLAGADFEFDARRVNVVSGATVSTRNASGDAGDVLITGHIIKVNGAIHTDATASHAAGNVTIDARDSLTSQQSYGVIFSPVDITITKASVTLTDADIKAGALKIDVESDSADLFDDTSEKGSPGEFFLDYLGSISVLFGLAKSNAEARIEISGGTIEAETLQMDTRALTDANINTITFFFAFAYGEAISRSVIALKDGADIDVEGDITINSESDVSLFSGATQNLIGVSTTSEKVNVTVALGYSNLVSRIDVESDVTIESGGSITAASLGERSSAVSSTAAYKDGTLATALNFGLHDTLLEVHLNGTITADGDIDAKAQLETPKNDVSAQSTVGTGGLFHAIESGLGGGPVWLGLFANLFDAVTLFDGSDEKTERGISAAINVGIGTNIVKVSIGDGATVTAGGNISLSTKSEEFPETSAISMLSSSEISQREAGISAAFTLGLYKNTAKSWVGNDATVTAGGDLVVQSKARVPYRVQYIYGEDLGSPITWMEKINYNLGIQNGFFSSWAEAIASAEEEAYGAMLNILRIDTVNQSWIGQNAVINVGQDLVVYAETESDTVNFVGSPLVLFNATAGSGVGGAVMVVGYENETTASIKAGAHITAGSLLMYANNDGQTISIGSNHSGTPDELNALLAGATFTPDLNFFGQASILIEANNGAFDDGRDAAPALIVNSHSIALEVEAVNDAPVITMPSYFSGDENHRFDVDGITVSDVEDDLFDITLEVATGTLYIMRSNMIQVQEQGQSISIRSNAAGITAMLERLRFREFVENGQIPFTITINDGDNTVVRSAVIENLPWNDQPQWWNLPPFSPTMVEDTIMDLTPIEFRDEEDDIVNFVVTVTNADLLLDGEVYGERLHLTGVASQLVAQLTTLQVRPIEDFVGEIDIEYALLEFPENLADTITVTDDGAVDVNDPPSLELQPVLTHIAESATERSKIADVRIIDDALGTNVLTLTADPIFELVGTEIFLLANSALDHETASGYDLTISVDDADLAAGDRIDFVLAITDVNEAPVVADQTFTFDENSTGLIGSIVASDPEGLALTYALDSADFAIDTTGELSALVAQDFESGDPVLTLTVTDPFGLSTTAQITIDLTDINEAPSLALTDTVASVSESADLSGGIAIAEVQLTDDALGDNQLSLGGDDADHFELDGFTLKLRTDALLDHETTPSLTVTVIVVDPAFGRAVDDAVTHTLVIDDGNDAPVAQDLDGVVGVTAPINTLAGKVTASDPNGDVLSYTILSGDGFRIDADSGQLFVDDTLAVGSYTLEIEVSDGQFTDTATVTFDVQVTNESPEVLDQTFTVLETATIGSPVGTVQVTDPDPGDAHTFDLDSSAFAIDDHGLITVADPAQLAHGTRHSAQVTVTDRDGLIATATIHIDIHFVLDIYPGWNHVSLPVEPVTDDLAIVFADAPIIGRILQFDSGAYTLANSAKSEVGYWFYAARTHQLPIPGYLADNIIDFPAGWTTFGPATDVLSPGRLGGIEAILSWDAPTQQYRAIGPTDPITPGHGYWAYALSPITHDLTATIARSATWLDPMDLDLDFDDELSSFED